MAAASPPNVSESTLLAVDRTRLAHERTLMAWVRMRALRTHYPDRVPYSNAMLVASLVAGFGILAFVAVLIGR